MVAAWPGLDTGVGDDYQTGAPASLVNGVVCNINSGAEVCVLSESAHTEAPGAHTRTYVYINGELRYRDYQFDWIADTLTFGAKLVLVVGELG